MYYNARWYDSQVGRFAQADTVIPNIRNLQSWDRYAYVNNSPVNYADPSGHYCVTYINGNQCVDSDKGSVYTVAESDSVKLTMKEKGKRRYGGANVAAIFHQYQITPGWWNNNLTSDFGIEQFLGMWALMESNSTLRFADVITTVIAQNLDAGGNNDAACVSQQCLNGVFNFMAAYSQGQGTLFGGPASSKNYISDRQGERGKLRDVTDAYGLISSLGSRAFSPASVVGDRWNGPSNWANINGANTLQDKYGVAPDTINGTVSNTIYFLFPSFAVYSINQRRYFEALNVDFSFAE